MNIKDCLIIGDDKVDIESKRVISEIMLDCTSLLKVIGENGFT